MGRISELLEQYTAEHSNFETKRNYISLSQIHMSPEQLLHTFYNGFEDGHEIRLRCYKGYQMERDLKARIIAVFGEKINPTVEISLHDGLVQGHPDLEYDGYPADCKTVPLDEHLPKDGKLSRKIYWQLQGYMHYKKVHQAVAIYESRETGIIRDIWITSNQSIQKEIQWKVDYVVQRIKQSIAA